MQKFCFEVGDTSCSRIDKFLSEKLGRTRNFVQKLLEKKLVYVNKSVAQKNYLLRVNDVVELTIPDSESIDVLPQNIPIEIVFEDDDVVVVNKPKGLVVHPSNGHPNGTLVNALLYHVGDSLSGINGILRPGIIHRIDKDTSGLLVCAKNDSSHNFLANMLSRHEIKREYEAIVFGTFKEKSGIIDAPIGRDRFNRKKMTVTSMNSKTAVTHFSVIKSFFNTKFGNCTHVRLSLETGRTHQIRVHMAYIGHPVCGDEVYGNGKPKFLNGQCLHAKKLEFIHPTSKKLMRFETDLPKYFSDFLSLLESET